MISSNYKILPVPELKGILKSESRNLYSHDIQLPHSYAFVYYLNSGAVILLPGNLWDKWKGVLFESKEIFEKYAKTDSFPIQNNDTSNEELFQSNIISIPESIPPVAAYLSELYSLNSTEGNLSNLLTVAQQRMLSNKTKDNKEYMYASLLLGEYIRERLEGRWILLKQYGTFNPYYVPAIINKADMIIILPNVVGLYFNGLISLDNFIKAPWISNPKLKFESLHFNSAYAGYKLVE